MENIYILGAEISSETILNYASLDKALLSNYSNKLADSEIINKNKQIISDYFGSRYLKKIDRAVQLSLYASENLLSKVSLAEKDKETTGIFLGNNYAGWGYVEEQMYGLYQGNYNSINPYVATAWFPAAAQGELSIRNKLFGISKTFSKDLLSTAIALEFSIDMLRLNKINYALVGGHEALISPIVSSSLKEKELIGENYKPSEAAGVILITNKIREGSKILAKIDSYIKENTLQEVLSKVKYSIDSEKIDYFLLPPINLDSIRVKKYLEEEIDIIVSNYTNKANIGMPSYFIGEIGGASFAVQLTIATWMIEKQAMPAGYMDSLNGEAHSDNSTNNNFKRILIIGRDYEAQQYVAVIIKNL